MIQIIFKKGYVSKKKIKKTILKSVNAVIKSENIDKFDIAFLITDNKQISKINNEFRNMDKPTDVLSFPSKDDFSGDEFGFYGDIAISLDKAKRQAKEYNQSLQRELSFLVVHGCLHLLGYDHLNTIDEKIMREKQRKIINLLWESNN